MARRKIILAVIIPMLLAAGCAVTPPAEDPVLIQLDELDRRIGAIERILANGSLIELTMQVDELQRQNATLQGRTESLEHGVESTASRQRDLYVDVDDRIQSLERSLQTQSAAVNVLDGGALF